MLSAASVVEIDEEDQPNMHNVWQLYNIKKTIDTLNSAWEEVKESTVNRCWKKLWPKCVNNFTGFGDDDTVLVPCTVEHS